MRSTMASAAARPAAIWLWPGWPNTTPVIVVRLPSIQRIARKAKQPPAASVEPVLTPTNPSRPSNVLVLCTVPAPWPLVLPLIVCYKRATGFKPELEPFNAVLTSAAYRVHW